MKRLLALVAASFTLVATAMPTQASPIVVDPDAFPNGTNISNAFSGVTLSGPGQSNSSVFSLTSGLASTGTQVFGSGDNGIEWGDGFNGGMRADFASPTNFVSIDIIGNDAFDQGQLLAYNSSDMLLGTYTTGILGNGQVETASISLGTFNIAYIIATGSGDGFESISLDNLQYNSAPVPEPATMAVFGLMAAGAFGVRRRLKGTRVTT